MKAKKFKLFLGCLGNGITVCNKAVEGNGDYKKIAHISDRGNIKFYVSEDYIPKKDMQKIRSEAEQQKNKFLEYWNSLPQSKQYTEILNNVSLNDFVTLVNGKSSIAEKILKMFPIFMAIH